MSNKTNFSKELLKKIYQLNITYRLLTPKDKLLNGELVDITGKDSIIRLEENSYSPLDIYLTTKGNYLITDKKGKQIYKIDHVYYTISDFINWLKRY